ncbi:Putative tyrosine-protein kinase F09A5.2, partial [Toxocara canis]
SHWICTELYLLLQQLQPLLIRSFHFDYFVDFRSISASHSRLFVLRMHIQKVIFALLILAFLRGAENSHSASNHMTITTSSPTMSTVIDESKSHHINCNSIGGNYPPGECQNWQLDVILGLRRDTSAELHWRIKDFILSSMSRCDAHSSITLFFKERWDNTHKCGWKCMAGSTECSATLQPIKLGFGELSVGDRGNSTVQLFDTQAKCAENSTLAPGRALFFVTNIPCGDINNELGSFVEKHCAITTKLMNIGYLFYIYYILDASSTSDSKACSVEKRFQCGHKNAHVVIERFHEGEALKPMFICPLRSASTIGFRATISSAILIMGIVTIATVSGYVYYKRKRNDRLQRLRDLSSPQMTTSRPSESSVELECNLEEELNRIRARYNKKAKYNQKSDEWEILPQDLFVHEEEVLGKGAFSIVYKGTLKGRLPVTRLYKNLSRVAENAENNSNEVGVKMLPSHADETSRIDFLNEIDFMKKLGYHTHIVSLIGCVTDFNEPKIVLEYFANGDLLRFLRCHKDGIALDDDSKNNGESISCLRLKDLLSIAWQVSDGMYYLSARNYVHRDVAARNVLLTKNLVAKIGDFGLCRYLGEALYSSKGGRMPIKWMAIESLKRYEYTTKSDVWSFGVLLFELFSMGDGPFPGVQPLDMIHHLENGYRNAKPDKCPDEIYDMMQACWQADPDRRPSFALLKTQLTNRLKLDDESYGYLNLKDTDDGYLKTSCL